MTVRSGPSVDVAKAHQIWDEYCRLNDVTTLRDQTAGIEPNSGRIWFGDSAGDVHDKMVADGIDLPAYFVRVGYDYYARKGARR